MTNIFIFESLPNTKPKEKKVGGAWHIMSPPPEKLGGHVPRSPHQIAPMLVGDAMLNCRKASYEYSA